MALRIILQLSRPAMLPPTWRFPCPATHTEGLKILPLETCLKHSASLPSGPAIRTGICSWLERTGLSKGSKPEKLSHFFSLFFSPLLRTYIFIIIYLRGWVGRAKSLFFRIRTLVAFVPWPVDSEPRGLRFTQIPPLLRGSLKPALVSPPLFF